MESPGETWDESEEKAKKVLSEKLVAVQDRGEKKLCLVVTGPDR